MKKIILLTYIMSLAGHTFAAPRELEALFPADSNGVLQFHGTDSNRQACSVSLQLFDDRDFLASVQGKKFAKFQLGLGHVLQKLESSNEDLMVVSVHKAEEQYSSDTRSTLNIKIENGVIQSVQVKVEEKFLGFYKTKLNETCWP